jgi:hypothetical protein
MSIQDIWKKINTGRSLGQWLVVVSIYGVISASFALFGLSMVSAKTGEVAIILSEFPAYTEQNIAETGAGSADTVYASKSGKKYYYKDCSGINRIKLENRVAFANAEMAEQSGYTKAANCH